MPNPRPPVVLATVLAALACAGESYLTGPLPPDGPTNIEVTTDRSSYDIGGAASVTLRNASADTVLYGACADVLEKRLYDGRWVALSPPPQNCPDIAFLLGPGESRLLPFDLGTATQSGTYRLRREFLPYQGPVEGTFYRRSNEFQIGG